MKIRIKKYLAFLPPGSIVVALDTKEGIVRRGKLKKITSGETINITLESVRSTLGKISWNNRDFLDPEKCIVSDSGLWAEEVLWTIIIQADPKKFGASTHGKGSIRIQSTQQNIDVLCFPPLQQLV